MKEDKKKNKYNIKFILYFGLIVIIILSIILLLGSIVFDLFFKKEKSEQFESHQNVRIIQFYSNRRKTVKMMKSTFPNPNTAI